MPELDAAVLCDYVRVEGGLAHMIAAGIDTISAQRVPASQSVGLYLRLLFSPAEVGRAHRVEIVVQDADGQRLVQLQGELTPGAAAKAPPGWKSAAAMGMNLGLSFPDYGVYSIEILVNDSSVKTIPLRVAETAGQG